MAALRLLGMRRQAGTGHAGLAAVSPAGMSQERETRNDPEVVTNLQLFEAIGARLFTGMNRLRRHPHDQGVEHDDVAAPGDALNGGVDLRLAGCSARDSRHFAYKRR